MALLVGTCFVSLVLILLCFIERPHWGLRKLASATTLLFVSTFAWLAISRTWSAFPENPWLSLLRLLALVLAVVSASLAWGNLPVRLRFALHLVVPVVGLALLLVAILAGWDDESRITFMGTGPNTFGRLLGASLAVLFILGIIWRSSVAMALTVFMSVGLWAAESRGSIVASLAMLIGLTVYFLIRRRNSLARLVIFWASHTLLWIVLVGFGGDSRTRSGRTYLPERFELLEFTAANSSLRLDLYSHAVSTFLQNPLFGVGLDGFRETFRDAFPEVQSDGGGYYVHNLLLAFAAEGGAVALALLGVFSALAFSRFYKGGRKSLLVIIPVAIGGIFFVASMFSGDYFDSRLFWFYLFVALAERETESFPQVTPTSGPSHERRRAADD